MRERIYIDRDICVDNISYEDCYDWVRRRIESGSQFPDFILSQNVLKVVASQRDQQLQGIMKGAGLVIPDGMGLILAMKLLGVNLKGQVAGIQLMEALIALSQKSEYKTYFLGAKPGVAEKAITNLLQNYPDLKIAGYRDGYFNKNETDDIIDQINQSKPDILFVAMGSPLQELFLSSHSNRLNVPVCMGVGGSFDILAGNVERAPKTYTKLGLEWLYRALHQPKRLLNVIPGFSQFLILVIKYRMRLFFDKKIISVTISTN